MPYVKKAFDGRTKAARSIRDVKKLIRSDLDAAAVDILQNDIASLSIIGRLCLEKALADPGTAIDDKGNLTPGLNNYLRIQTQVKAGLLALQKFQSKKPTGLADLFNDED